MKDHEIKIAQKLVDNANKRIDEQTEAEIKADMKHIVTSLIKFVAEEKPEILLPDTPEDKMGMLFFKMIGKIISDAVTAKISPFHKRQLEQKFEGVMSLWPLLKKYSNDAK